MLKIITEHVDPVTGTFYSHTSEDVQPLMDSLAEQRNHGDQNEYKKRPARQRKIGDLPMTILADWFSKGFNAFDPANERELYRRLSTDYKAFLSVDKI